MCEKHRLEDFKCILYFSFFLKKKTEFHDRKATFNRSLLWSVRPYKTIHRQSNGAAKSFIEYAAGGYFVNNFFPEQFEQSTSVQSMSRSSLYILEQDRDVISSETKVIILEVVVLFKRRPLLLYVWRWFVGKPWKRRFVGRHWRRREFIYRLRPIDNHKF